MTTFDEREKGEERKFAMDEENLFKARARRDRLVAQWAGDKLGLKGAEIETYAKGLLGTDIEKHGDTAVIAKLKLDLAAKSISISDQQIELVLREKMIQAQEEIKQGR